MKTAHKFTLTLLSIVALTASLNAQTSGNIATQTAANWNAAPWVITSGPGTFPDGGGVATWNPVIASTPGTVGAGTTLTLTAPITLSGITYNSPFSMTLAGSAVNNLALSGSGATFNVALSIANTPTLFQLANNTTAPISGGGSAGLTKTGNGTMTLGATAASTYTGGTHINGGILVISTTAAVGDAVLGASGAGNGISMDGGGLFNNITGGWTTSRDISLGAGGGTIYLNTLGNFNGVISGAGSLNYNGFAAAGVMTLTNTNTYTGNTLMSSTVGTLTLSGNGSITTSSGYDFAGTVNLTNTATNLNDRLSDTAGITMRGAALNVLGNASAATSETVGAMTLANGNNTITLTPNAAQQTTLTMASMTRQNNSTLFVRGTNLGGPAGPGVSQIFSTVAPGTMIGGGGAAGSTNISILPWAYGNILATGVNNSNFVTYDASVGFRPLAPNEYSTLVSGVSTTDNTRMTAATAISAPTTVNSLVVVSTGTSLTGTGGLNITSGALMYAPGATTAGTISANINFGSAEGVLTNTASGGLTMSGVLSGTNGLTVNPAAGLINFTGLNTYTGTTTVLGGTTEYSGTVTNDGVTASAFGTGTSAIVMNPGTAASVIFATGVATFNRDLMVIGGPGIAEFGTTGNTTLVMNGNINMPHDLVLAGGGTAASAMVINGNISGAGVLSDAFAAFQILNGNNTYSGGTNIQTGTYEAGSDTAFGTGTIYFSNAGFIQSSNATAHTLANNIFTSANPTFSGTGALTFTGGVNLNGARSFAITNTAATGVTFSGVVSNGALTKTGTGILSLNSTTGNTYTGGTVLGASAGTLNLNNTSGSATGSGAVSIGGTTAANRSTLSGNFIVSGATSISGALNPGNSVGTANFGSTLSLTSNALVTMELGSAVSGDHINVAGLLTLGSSTWNIVTIGGYVAQAGDSFDLVDWGSLSGTATLNLAGAITAAGTSWDTSTFLTDGTIRVVPEPGTFALCFAGGLSILVAYQRRKNRS